MKIQRTKQGNYLATHGGMVYIGSTRIEAICGIFSLIIKSKRQPK